MPESKHRGWVIVVNFQPEENETHAQAIDKRNKYLEEELKPAVKKDDRVKYAIFGREGSKPTKTPHLQGYIQFKYAVTFNSVKALSPRAHLEGAKGSPKQNKTYCSKEQKDPSDIWEYGKAPQQGKRCDLDDVAEALSQGTNMREIAEEFPVQFIKYHRGITQLHATLSDSVATNEVRGIWISGPPGAGKSHSVREFCEQNDMPLYVKPQSKWFDGYNGEPAILLDDLDIDILGHYLKIWADKYKCTGEVKGGTVNLMHKVFFVTSNKSCSEMYTTMDGKHDAALKKAVERRFTHLFFSADTRRDHLTMIASTYDNMD